jgi:hypothetical protein
MVAKLEQKCHTTEKSKLEKTWQNWAKLEQKCSFAPVL